MEEQKRKWSLIGKSKEEDAIKAKLKLEQNKAAIAARQRQLASVPIPSTLLAPGRQMKKKTKLKRFDEFGDEIIGDNDDKRDQDDEDVAAVAVSVEMSMAPLLWALQGDQALPKMIGMSRFLSPSLFSFFYCLVSFPFSVTPCFLTAISCLMYRNRTFCSNNISSGKRT